MLTDRDLDVMGEQLVECRDSGYNAYAIENYATQDYVAAVQFTSAAWSVATEVSAGLMMLLGLAGLLVSRRHKQP